MTMEKTLQEVLNDVYKSEPHIILQSREIGKKSWNKYEGDMFDNKILRWMDCLVLAYRMDCQSNVLQVAVEGKPYDWGK